MLEPDGRARFGGDAGQWVVQDGTLMLHDGHEWASASLDGDVLAIHTTAGTIMFVRQHGAHTAAPRAGSIDPRLIGCWEDYAASTSGNGSGQFSRTVTFAADGTYVARSFTSISAGDFSSADEDVEDGHWHVVDSTVWFAPRQTAAYQTEFLLDGGLLIVNRTRFVPCS